MTTATSGRRKTGTVTLRWAEPDGPTRMLAFVPARFIAEGFDVIVAAGETIRVPAGPVFIVVKAPGFQDLTRRIEVASGEASTVVLRPTELTPDQPPPAAARRRTAATAKPGRRVAVDVAAWTADAPTPLRTATDIRLRADRDSLLVSRQTGVTLPLRLEVAGRATPKRLLAVPYVSESDTSRVVWHQEGGAVARPRVEPDDPGGQLLMAYLQAGEYGLAAAAARTVQRDRGEASWTDWAAPSYTQLLIGYAYALGRDRARLAAWCRRTLAERTLNTDGLVLAAEAAWQASDRRRSRCLLAAAAGLAPPTLTYGAEIGLRLASLLAASRSSRLIQFDATGESAEELLRVTNDWLRLLTRADAHAATVSLPQTHTSSPDVSGASWLVRARWFVRYVLTSRLYDHTLRFGSGQQAHHTVEEDRTVSRSFHSPQSSKPQRTSRWWFGPISSLVLAYLVWVVVIGWVVVRASADSVEWTRLAFALSGVQAIVFAAAGGLFALSAYRERIMEAERRAFAAEEAASRYYDQAMKGRALAAALQAEVPRSPDEKTLVVRHQRLALSLFGDLIGAHGEEEVTGAG